LISTRPLLKSTLSLARSVPHTSPGSIILAGVHKSPGEFMARPNYSQQKKQREQAAKKKREEKQQRRQQRKEETPPPPAG
jgi:hypothetical protein